MFVLGYSSLSLVTMMYLNLTLKLVGSAPMWFVFGIWPISALSITRRSYAEAKGIHIQKYHSKTVMINE